MKTTEMFDAAWRDLQSARHEENLNHIIEAAERLGYAGRMMKLDQQQQVEEDSVPLDPKALNKA